MTPREAISEREYDMLNAYRDVYAPSPESRTEILDMADMKIILSVWEEQKTNLFNVFGEKLILSKPIKVRKNHNALMDEFYKINNDASTDFFLCYNSIKTMFFDIYNSPSVEKAMNIFGFQFENINQLYVDKNWVNNAFCESIKITFPEGDCISSQRGGSVIRFMNKLIKRARKGDYIDEESIQRWEKFRLWHSRILNDAILEGELCLSIHPMDFLTASDNDCDWTSCLRFRNIDYKGIGDYRAGTVEMMNSPYVVCAYLKSKKDMEIVHTDWDDETYYWNNKRWRSFYIVTPTGAISMRGFPYDNETLDNEVLSWIGEIFNKNSFIRYYPDEIVRVRSANELHDEGYGYWKFSTSLMYNDFWKEHSFMASNLTEGNMHYNIDLGEYTQCLVCGELYEGDAEYSHQVTCYLCENKITWCEMCKCQEATNFNGLCDDCYNDNLIYDIYDVLMGSEKDIDYFTPIQAYNADNFTAIYVRDFYPFKHQFFVTRHDVSDFPARFFNKNVSGNLITMEDFSSEVWDILYDKINRNIFFREQICYGTNLNYSTVFEVLKKCKDSNDLEFKKNYFANIAPLIKGEERYSIDWTYSTIDTIKNDPSFYSAFYNIALEEAEETINVIRKELEQLKNNNKI